MESSANVKLFVGGLPPTANDEDLWQAFSYHVPVLGAKVEVGKYLGVSRCFGYVDIANSAFEIQALRECVLVQGCRVDIQWARPGKYKSDKKTSPKTMLSEHGMTNLSTCYSSPAVPNWHIGGGRFAKNGKCIMNVQSFNPQYSDIVYSRPHSNHFFGHSSKPNHPKGFQVNNGRQKKRRINWIHTAKLDESNFNYRFNRPN